MKVFHQSQYPDVTDLTGYKTKSLGLLVTVRWCFLAERKKINWVFESFNESLLTASQHTSLSYSAFTILSILLSVYQRFEEWIAHHTMLAVSKSVFVFVIELTCFIDNLIPKFFRFSMKHLLYFRFF